MIIGIGWVPAGLPRAPVLGPAVNLVLKVRGPPHGTAKGKWADDEAPPGVTEAQCVASATMFGSSSLVYGRQARV